MKTEARGKIAGCKRSETFKLVTKLKKLDERELVRMVKEGLDEGGHKAFEGIYAAMELGDRGYEPVVVFMKDGKFILDHPIPLKVML